ncbi:MAG: signal recognition particle-docking protein FtsY [Methanobacteriota archaeon]
MFDGLRDRLRRFSKEVEEKAVTEAPTTASGAPSEGAKPGPTRERAAGREAASRPHVPPRPPQKPPAVAAKPPGAGPAPADAPASVPSPPRTPAIPPAPKAPTAAKPPPPAEPVPTSKGKAIDPSKLDDLLWDLELLLLESDVALPVVEAIRKDLVGRLKTIRVAASDEVQPAVEKALREALLQVLSQESIDFDELVAKSEKPFVVMFVGVNGTGKTTAIARIAHRLKENGYTSVIAAGDTFRAGAIQQLELHGERLGVRVVKHQSGADPAAVAFDAIQHAKSRLKDVVLLDTAGRMQTNINLMDEMVKIKRVANPHLVVFVGDSLAGNDAVEQAVKFHAAVGVDAVILTKVDTDARGGAALSIAHAVGKPILFLGVGQEYGDLIPFERQWLVDRVFQD